jgi:hypothetical protein
MTENERTVLLARYAAGEIGTRRTIEAIDGRDYADLVIAMAQTDLAFPKPAATPAHQANVARARAVLQPRLRHGA